jgi:hypothetical protein
MSIEQVARDVVMNMTKLDKVKTMVTADAMASGGVLQKEIPITESLKVTAGLLTASPGRKLGFRKNQIPFQNEKQNLPPTQLLEAN